MFANQMVQSALAGAVSRLLRPIVRMLLRHAMPYAAFEALAKRVYVDVALKEFAIEGKKSTISRASILTGLTRKEVQRLRETPMDDSAITAQQYNRAARVLTAWAREPAYRDARGRPLVLDIEGDRSFAELVRLHSGDMPMRAVLDELVRVGAIMERRDGRIELLHRAYVPQQSMIDKLAILGTDVAYLAETIDHNIHAPSEPPRFQRKVLYQGIPLHALPAFRALSAKQGQQMLEKLDAWLAERAQEDVPEHEQMRVGVGIYYFEKPGDEPAPDLQKEHE